ncbi:MAG: class I SAM-dependent methyltransferase [Methanobacteriota archaeon]|nr:MAG: class I SAM-dependent methyltransferase [Euryarchaeota archaeon]
MLRPTESRADYIRFYDEVGASGIESSAYDEDPVANERLHCVNELIERYVPTAGMAIDLGCYDGKYCGTIVREAETVGLDISRNALLRGKADSSFQIEWLQGDVESLPLRSESFDFVLFSETLEHVPSPEIALAECARILRSQGVLIVTTPNAIVVRSSSPFSKLRNAILGPSGACHEVEVNPRFTKMGIEHAGYLHGSRSPSQITAMGKGLGLTPIHAGTCAISFPNALKMKGRRRFSLPYAIAGTAFKYIPVLRMMGNHSVVVFKKT